MERDSLARVYLLVAIGALLYSFVVLFQQGYRYGLLVLMLGGLIKIFAWVSGNSSYLSKLERHHLGYVLPIGMILELMRLVVVHQTHPWVQLILGF